MLTIMRAWRGRTVVTWPVCFWWFVTDASSVTPLVASGRATLCLSRRTTLSPRRGIDQISNLHRICHGPCDLFKSKYIKTHRGEDRAKNERALCSVCNWVGFDCNCHWKFISFCGLHSCTSPWPNNFGRNRRHVNPPLLPSIAILRQARHLGWMFAFRLVIIDDFLRKEITKSTDLWRRKTIFSFLISDFLFKSECTRIYDVITMFAENFRFSFKSQWTSSYDVITMFVIGFFANAKCVSLC